MRSRLSLFDASTNLLTEEATKPFPMKHKGPGGASKLPGGQGINRSAVRDRVAPAVLSPKKVDGTHSCSHSEGRAAAAHRRGRRARYLAFYQEVTKNPDAIIGMVAGVHDDTSPSALAKLVWPLFQAGSTLKRTRALVRLKEAVSLNRHASGIDQVWRAVFDKRCQTILVETDFHYPADLAPDGDRLLPYTGRGAAALDDAVDEVIERVLADGGEVFFYEPGVLDLHQQIAAVLREVLSMARLP